MSRFQFRFAPRSELIKVSDSEFDEFDLGTIMRDCVARGCRAVQAAHVAP